MKIAIIYEDKSIFVSFTSDEFIVLLEKKLLAGLTVSQAMDEIISELKRKTLTS